MPYYHVYINEVDEVCELDLTKQQLLSYIVENFLRGNEFICKGYRVDPSLVDRITIVETEKSSKELLPEVRKKYPSFLGLPITSDEEIIMKEGRDVTRQFIIRLPNARVQEKAKTSPMSKKRIFIIHGADTEPVKELERILKEVGLQPMVLHEQPSKGKTIIEKLEEYAGKVDYVFVVLTPDDMGESMSHIAQYLENHPNKKAVSALKARPRQNVIFEFGYFAGKLGRKRVCYLKKGNPDLPSDIEGIVYIPFLKSMEECKRKIIKELKAAGYRVED